MPKDMRTFIDDLLRERPGELKRVVAECDPKFGVTAVAAKFEQRDQFPALYFEKVAGSNIPLAINLTATYERLALALGTSVDQAGLVYGDRAANPIAPI
jgi:UbiD family decarboxylase